MTTMLHRYATPLIASIFIISLVSGVALFTRFGTSYFRSMHEWLSMVLLVPFALHLWRNWRPFAGYFARSRFLVAMALPLAVALGFAYQSNADSNRVDGPPQFAVIKTLEANTPAQLAPLLGTTPDALVIRLKNAGFAGAAPGDSLSEIAREAGKDDIELSAALLPPQ